MPRGRLFATLKGLRGFAGNKRRRGTIVLPTKLDKNDGGNFTV
jgi:hypothetical protein